MTPRERTLAVVARERPDRLPHEFRLTPPLLEDFQKRTGVDDPAEYYSLDVRDVFFHANQGGGLQRVLSGRCAALVEPGRLGGRRMGRGRQTGLDAPFRAYRTSDEAELRPVGRVGRYSFPDLTLPERHQHLDAQVRGYHDRGLFVIGFMEWTIFELAWHMRGMEELFSDLAFNPPFAEYLLDRITNGPVSRRGGTRRRAWTC